MDIYVPGMVAMTHDIGGMARGRTMTVSERLRANLNLALAHHRCAGGPELTITTLAPLAGSSRFTLARLGGHTRLSTLQGIAGALGCTVADLVEGVEALMFFTADLADVIVTCPVAGLSDGDALKYKSKGYAR